MNECRSTAASGKACAERLVFERGKSCFRARSAGRLPLLCLLRMNGDSVAHECRWVNVEEEEGRRRKKEEEGFIRRLPLLVLLQMNVSLLVSLGISWYLLVSQHSVPHECRFFCFMNVGLLVSLGISWYLLVSLGISWYLLVS